MNRYLLSLATLSTLAVLPLSPPLASGAASEPPSQIVADIVTDKTAAFRELSSDAQPVKLSPILPLPPKALAGTSKPRKPEAPSADAAQSTLARSAVAVAGRLAPPARAGTSAAQTTRFGSAGYPESLVAAVPGARDLFASPPEIAPAVPVRVPEVLVVGGTPAGVAAALSAARHGAHVTLVSDSDSLGGVLTDAMMDQWDLNRAPGGRSIEGGIFPKMYAKLGDSFAPADAARAFAAMVAAEPNVRVIFNAATASVDTSSSNGGRRIERVVIRDLHSRRTTVLRADAVVDATDDADVVARAGARYDVGRQDTGIDERTQSVTLMFAMENVDWPTLESTYRFADYGPGGASGRRAWGYAKFARRYKPVDANTVVSDLNFGHLRDGSVTANAVDLCNVNGLSKADRARAYALGQRESYALLAYLRTHLPGFAHARIARFADRLYVRETRHVAGLATITTDDIWQGRVPSDTIGLSSYPIDLHAVVPTQPPAFATVRHVYGIPFGALTPRGLTNAVMASPSISATHLASGSARVVPTTVEEGEAAGLAAAISARDGVDLATIARDPVRLASLRESLVAGGTILEAPPRATESVATDRTVTTTRTWEFLASPG